MATGISPARLPWDWRTAMEDAYGLIVAAIMLSMGAYLLHVGKVITGGTVGLSLLLATVTALPYWLLFAGMNIPLFMIGWRRMGTAFIFKSLAVTGLTAGLMMMMPAFFIVTSVSPLLSALAGGTLVGMGALAAARHGAGAGGTLVIVLWLQKQYRLNAGIAQLCFDLLVIALSAFLLDPVKVAWSTLGVVAADAMIIIWHRTPQRAYCAASSAEARGRISIGIALDRAVRITGYDALRVRRRKDCR